MKKLLLPLFFIPFITSAQVEISALGGASFNIGTYKYFNELHVNAKNIVPFGSLKVAYLTGGFNFGVSADVISIKQTWPGEYEVPGSSDLVKFDYVVKAYKPGLNISVFANKVFEQSESSFHVGLNAGYIFNLSSGADYKNVSDPSVTPIIIKPGGNFNGITFGFQAGYTYKLTDRLRLKAEIAPRFLYSLKFFNEKDKIGAYNTIILPVAAGLSFVL
jgi:hypothetical protein